MSMDDYDVLLDKLFASELGCLFYTELDNKLSIIRRHSYKKLTYKDKIGIIGKQKSAGVVVFELHYTDGLEADNIEIGACIEELYYRWCGLNKIKPNPKEGWFKSKRFMDYVFNKIYFDQMNYAVMWV